MANDRYDTRRERSGYSDYDRERGRYQERGRDDDRGFFERAGDEVASWFGDEEAERRRREDERMNHGWGERDYDRDRSARASGRDFDRGRFEQESRGGRPMSDREYRSSYAGYERDFSPRGYGPAGIDRGFAPGYVAGQGYTGGYGAGSGNAYGAGTGRGYGGGGFGGSDYERREGGGRDFGRGGYGRSQSPYGRDDYPRTSFAGSRDTDRSYMAWRQRQLDELDRDYDEYRRENQERFESDFGTWRQNRQQKRGLLGRIREHMDVVGSDGEEIGKVDCVKGDRVILTKSDSDDNRHHSIKCTMIDTVEGEQVRLDIPAEEAKNRWKDEDERGFFRREEEDRDVNLERSFAGTYR